MSGRGRNRNAVQYVQNDEPSFIQKFKESIGYKEGPSVNTKRQQLEYDSDDDAPEHEDEQPTVVVLKDGDLTEEQADLAKKEQEGTASCVEDISKDKITFKKPVKRASEDDANTDLNVSTSNKKKKESEEKKSKSEGKKVKNSSLLSFGDDEEDD